MTSIQIALLILFYALYYIVMFTFSAVLLSYKAHKDQRRMDGWDFIFALLWPVSLPFIMLLLLFDYGSRIGVVFAQKNSLKQKKNNPDDI